jgi:phosphoglycolate phosphatase
MRPAASRRSATSQSRPSEPTRITRHRRSSAATRIAGGDADGDASARIAGPTAPASGSDGLDLDGTLVDSCPDIAAALNEALCDGGPLLPRFGEDEVRTLIGDGAAELVRRAHAARGRAPDGDALDRFRASYAGLCLERTAAYPGIRELLERLRAAPRRRVVVITNKPTDFSERVVSGLGLSSFVDAVLGPERVSRRKPHPAHVLEALEPIGVRPGQAVVVGDGPTDVRAGRAAGCATIAVTWGYRPRAELEAESPDALVDSCAELGRLLLGS